MSRVPKEEKAGELNLKYIKSNYKGNSKELIVFLFNDLHFGSENVDYKLLDRCFKFIDRHRDHIRILINGDIIDGITKQSKGNIYNQKLSPKEQIDVAVNKFKPYKDLIDGVTIGNHDWRIENETSIDPVEMFCRYLGVEDKYIGSQGVVGFSWNKMFYSIQMHHGTGGGGTIASVENAMKKLWKSDTDVMYCGHWHKEFSKPVKRFSIDPYNNKVREDKRWMVCGNTIVHTEEYARRGGYEEGFPSQAFIRLSGKRGQKGIEIEWIR